MDEPVQGQGAPPELEDRILPWSQVKVISGLSRTTVWRLQKTGDFPASVQVSRNRVGWWQSEILEWRRSRLPRRLPEPKVVPVPVEVPQKRRAAPEKARTEAPHSLSVETVEAPRTRVQGRRRPRKECEHQGAFDF